MNKDKIVKAGMLALRAEKALWEATKNRNVTRPLHDLAYEAEVLFWKVAEANCDHNSEVVMRHAFNNTTFTASMCGRKGNSEFCESTSCPLLEEEQ